MQKNKLLVVALGALFALPALAADAPPYTITSNVGLMSNYVWRGISQTTHKPAIQGGFDYAHSGGFYAGVWGSNVSWIVDTATTATGNATLELDTYFGFKSSLAKDFTYDVGFIRYNYPGTYTSADSTGVSGTKLGKADTNEVYGAIGYKWITAKYSHGLGSFLTLPDAKGTNYFDLTASYPVADSGFTVVAHVGRQTYKGKNATGLAAIKTRAAGTGTPTYTDYKLGVTKDFSGYVVGLAYTDTNASSFYTTSAVGNTGKKLGKGTATLSLTRSF